MTDASNADRERWLDASRAAALFAIDPVGTGGVSLRAHVGPVRDRWLEHLCGLLPAGTVTRRIPAHVPDGRLLGGLDLTATLRAGRPVVERGILVEADGGITVIAMAERLEPFTAARLVAVLDSHEVRLERDGLAAILPTRFGVVALDEGIAADEHPPDALRDRLAFHLDLGAIARRCVADDAATASDIVAARARLHGVRSQDAIVEALCGAALAFGITSIRAPLLALRVARAAAALAGRSEVADEDATLSARLVYAPRATTIPMPPPPDTDEQEPSVEPAQDPESCNGEQQDDEAGRPLEDVILEATRAAIPAGLLAALRSGPLSRSRSQEAGRAGALRIGRLRGRPAGVRRGEPRTGARLNVVETLRAAAPWQPLRRQVQAASTSPRAARIEVRPDDFRVTRFKQRSQTTSIFVVDASGSSALHRLAEAKGAVELLLADCYVRRDHVALIAFRGAGAELILPPTRSLVRAKRGLAGLPGGGGTPLASGLEAAYALAIAIRRRGDTPVLIVLTDGQANIAIDGKPGRQRAEEDALAAAKRLRLAAFASLLVDTSPRPRPAAARLAAEMDARYLPLPHADARALSQAVRVVAGVDGSAASPALAR